MKIEKLSDNTIKFIIDKEELYERNLTVDNMKYGSNNVHSLFNEVVQIANIKLGFKNGTPLVVEAVPLKNGSIEVNVTRVSAPDELDYRFSKFSPAPDYNSNNSNMINPSFMQMLDAAFNKIEMGIRERQLPIRGVPFINNVRLEDRKTKEWTKIFSFNSIDEASAACKALGFRGFVSSFYKNEKTGKYFLTLSVSEELGEGELYEVLNKVSNTLSEYGEKVDSKKIYLAYFREHYKVIIEKDAVYKLSLL